MANATAGGPYAVTASDGVGLSASFNLTNLQAQPVFLGLTTDQTITYGTASIDVSGNLRTSSWGDPVGATISITIGTASGTAIVQSDGSFSTAIDTASVDASAIPYTIAYAFAGTTNYAPASDGSTTLTVNPATLTASIVGDPTKPYDGTAAAALTSADFSLSGLVGGEGFTVTQTAGTYDSADVATATTVTAALLAGDFTPGPGTLASNYILPTAASGPGSITAVAVDLTGVRTYDGTDTASYTLLTVSNAITGDTVDVASAAAPGRQGLRRSRSPASAP